MAGILFTVLSVTGPECRPMIDKPPPFKGLTIRVPTIIPLSLYNPYIYIPIYYKVVSMFFSIIPVVIPIKERGFIDQGYEPQTLNSKPSNPRLG